jgi:hypothetical protein
MIIFNDFPGSVSRGDKELWELFSGKFIDLNCNIEPATFNKILDETFQTIIKEGKKMDEDFVFFDSFKKRGMSHGYISLRWWEGHILPILKSRYVEEYKKNKRFYRDTDGRWYIDLPEYLEAGLGTKANLEMVAGADDLLSELAEGETSIYLRFSDQPIEGHQIHIKRNSDYGYTTELTDDPEWDPGGWYHIVEKRKWYQFKKEPKYLWLCPVTLYLFNGKYPRDIYISKYQSI